MAIKCDYHAWEGGYVLLRDSPYMAKTDEDGDFEISNLPYGTHTFKIWHERIGYLRNISFGQHKTNARGEVTIRIDKATTQLATAKVPSTTFGRSRTSANQKK